MATKKTTTVAPRDLAALNGHVQRVIYSNDSFTIFTFYEFKGSSAPISVKGVVHGIPRISKGLSLRVLGQWVQDPKYGKQLKLTSWEPWGANVSDVTVFLQTLPDFEGDDWPRGPSTARKLAQKYGVEAFDALTKGDLSDLDVSDAAKKSCLASWRLMQGLRTFGDTLNEVGFTSFEIQACFGSIDGGVEAVQANPYILADLVAFAKVDKLATRFNIGPSDVRRTQGLTLLTLKQALLDGHLFLDGIAEIRPKFLLTCEQHKVNPAGVSDQALEDALKALEASQKVTIEKGAVYLRPMFGFETAAAQLLADRIAVFDDPLDPINAETFLQEFEAAGHILLSDPQREAVKLASNGGVTVITGLPGTGKTTVTKAIVRMFQEGRRHVVLMAPTGIAAKRLANLAEYPAATIHRALGFDGSKWKLNEHTHMMADVVVVDEMSMVDMELLYRLISALPESCRVILVGDAAQLPSVGAGNVLRDLVACSAMPCVNLTQIFRQSSKGEIVVCSHQINRGETPTLDSDPATTSEFRFIPVDADRSVTGLATAMAAKLKSQNANFQVLSCRYEGAAGVDAINESIQAKLNPDGLEVQLGQLRLRIGDRIMVTRNDYRLGVYNGDVGKLVAADSNTKMVVLRIHSGIPMEPDREIEMPFQVAEHVLKLAYCITVHKSQGSEFDTIILPMTRSQGRMLQRNLLYTAVTRAKKRVYLLGTADAISTAVGNNTVIFRNTKLGARILEGITDAQRRPIHASSQDARDPDEASPNDSSPGEGPGVRWEDLFDQQDFPG